MFDLDHDKAQKILVTELGYQPHEAVTFLKDFPSLHQELSEAVNRWFEDRTVIGTDFGGITIEEVMRSQDYHFLLAIKEVNRLLDTGLSPTDRQRLAEILRKPAIHR